MSEETNDAIYLVNLWESEQFRRLIVEPLFEQQVRIHHQTIENIDSEERAIRFAQGALSAVSLFHKRFLRAKQTLSKGEKK